MFHGNGLALYHLFTCSINLIIKHVPKSSDAISLQDGGLYPGCNNAMSFKNSVFSTKLNEKLLAYTKQATCASKACFSFDVVLTKAFIFLRIFSFFFGLLVELEEPDTVIGRVPRLQATVSLTEKSLEEHLLI